MFFCLAVSAYADKDTDATVRELTEAVRKKETYSRQKEQRITTLKRLLTPGIPALEKYQINRNLYQEYKKFKIDTAVFYASQNQEIAQQLNRQDLLLASQLQLTNLYSSLGKFLEAEQLLHSVSSKPIPRPLLADYYEAKIQFYEHYATNSYNQSYVMLIRNYRDSLLRVLPVQSVRYRINHAQQYVSRGDLKQAQDILLHLMKSSKSTEADYAMITYLLAHSYQMQNRSDLAVRYYALSALADVKNSIKDNASLQDLALIFYRKGDLDKAYLYTRSAIEDAIFCNVKFRTLRISELYTIINRAYMEKEDRQKDQLQLYLALISILSVFLSLAIVRVYKQMKKVSRIKEELRLSGEELIRLNREISEKNLHLSDVNARLSEANQVKEAYIAQFFDLCSTYINKLEDYRKMLNKKANEKHLDELFKMLRSTSVADHELEGLYKVFDNIFLSLYPNFVTEFNALLIPEEQIVLKPGELLNTELRIFALARLGITDSVKIAAFLRYSLSTIYNYRTRARNKALVSRDDFETQVMKIGMLPANS